MANPLLRMAWRLGLGWFVGRYVLLLTTIGRDSGKLHRVPVCFVFRGGTFYVKSDAGETTDWYRNLETQPVCTTQTWPGPKAARARRLTDPGEVADVTVLFGTKGPIHGVGDAEAIHPIWIALEPTAQKAPTMLEPDLIWAWPLVAALGLIWLRSRRARS
jgi:hypothetical protein